LRQSTVLSVNLVLPTVAALISLHLLTAAAGCGDPLPVPRDHEAARGLAMQWSVAMKRGGLQ
jgi:hypothetical protein